MNTYEHAVSQILENTPVMPVQELPLASCLGLVAADDVYSAFTIPMLATGGPDGYAALSSDLAGASKESPVTLRILETVHAGVLPRKRVVSGYASRIMTGSTAPEGADCVVRFEDTDEPVEKSGPNPAAPKFVKIFVSPKPGENIMPAGHTIKEGALALARGTVIGPSQIAALTAIGAERIRVHRRPVVAIICTGDELIPNSKPITPGKIYNSNGPALAALIQHLGGVPKLLGVARDSMASLEKKVRQGASYDAILTSGGVSKGDYDLVRLMMNKLGRLVFNRLLMGPGAAFSFGVLPSNNGEATVPFFGLSGPPTGCLINGETMVRPALRKMLGYSNTLHAEVEAVALDGAASRAPFNFVRWTQLRRTAEGYEVQFGVSSGPGGIASLATGNSLTILKPGMTIQPGDKVKVLPMDWAI